MNKDEKKMWKKKKNGDQGRDMRGMKKRRKERIKGFAFGRRNVKWDRNKGKKREWEMRERKKNIYSIGVSCSKDSGMRKEMRREANLYIYIYIYIYIYRVSQKMYTH